jgi:aminomethyltransferase
MPTTSKRTPLHQVHVELGATLTDFAGWAMPLKYGSEVAEHHAVRTAAGIFDLTHMGELEITGADAGGALDYALVGRPSAMRVGQARYTMLVNVEGGILDDLVVYRLADERYLIVANASNAHLVHSELVRRTARHRAHVHDASDEWALIAVQGPASPQIVGTATGRDVSDLKYYSVEPSAIAGADVLLARTGYTGEDGFEVYIRTPDALRVWTALWDAGQPHLTPCGLASRDSLRLEAGMPLYGQELTSDVTPFDVGLGRVVVFDKPGDFVGRVALEKLRHDEPSRSLVGLASSERRAPRTGHAVLDANTGEQVGVVTSGVPSPTLGHAVAMALIDRTELAPGQQLAVDIRGREQPVEVVTLPFYRRAK